LEVNMVLTMNRKSLFRTIILGASLLMLVSIFEKPGITQTRQRDGWGIVTDQNDNPVDNESVKFYQYYGPNYERRRYFTANTTGYSHGQHGRYSGDAPEGYYALLVRENTSDEGGWLKRWLVPDNIPRLFEISSSESTLPVAKGTNSRVPSVSSAWFRAGPELG